MEFDLGTGIVLDAHNMYEGMYVEIQGNDGKKRPFIISKLVDDHQIVMRPLTTWESVRYNIQHHKVLASLVTISLAILTSLAIMVLLRLF